MVYYAEDENDKFMKIKPMLLRNGSSLRSTSPRSGLVQH